MDLHQCWRAKVQISPWCETKRTKMKASAPEEENRNGNSEGLCHLENRQWWHWKHYLVEEEKPAQRATWSFIPSNLPPSPPLFPLPPRSSPSMWWMLFCFPQVIFLCCFMSGFKSQNKSLLSCSRHCCLSESFKSLWWHHRHFLLINRDREASHLKLVSINIAEGLIFASRVTFSLCLFPLETYKYLENEESP